MSIINKRFNQITLKKNKEYLLFGRLYNSSLTNKIQNLPNLGIYSECHSMDEADYQGAKPI